MKKIPPSKSAAPPKPPTTPPTMGPMLLVELEFELALPEFGEELGEKELEEDEDGGLVLLGAGDEGTLLPGVGVDD